MPRLVTAACALALVFAACGDDDDEPGQSAAAPAADLTVTVHPDGPDGPAQRRHVECARLGEGDATCRGLAGLGAEQLAPVPSGTACTQIYGGPATARVQGTLRGRGVDARFELSDGCEIERWDRNRVLLDDPPRGA